MRTVEVNASRRYPVRIGSGLLSDPDGELVRMLSGRTAAVVSDDTVYGLYGGRLERRLSEAGVRTERFVFPHGEQSKNLAVYGQLLESLCAARMTRNDVVLAVGGGVTGDLAGFAAATYQRGIGLIQIPTTLLAAVDSSVGGKTAVNLGNGKNQAGAFYQPSLVLCDTDTFRTLPEEEYRNGCAEVIKYGMIGGKDLFDRIASLPVRDRFEEIVGECVSLKRDFVESDERDTGARRMLNFGHTVGHAVEACSGYTAPHGSAVAIGMAVVTKAAAAFGICQEGVYGSLRELLERYGLPAETDYSAAQLFRAAMTDKKRNGSTITIVVPEDAGSCALLEIPEEGLMDWIKAGGVK